VLFSDFPRFPLAAADILRDDRRVAGLRPADAAESASVSHWQRGCGRPNSLESGVHQVVDLIRYRN
jgi:hypothetical protein